MRYFIYPLCFFLLFHSLQAQKITVDQDSIFFGPVFTVDADTQTFSITNHTTFTIKIYDINSYDPAFIVLDTTISIAGGGSEQVSVVFQPRHNITYDSEIVVIPISDEGSLAIDVVGVGEYEETYYNVTQNLSEEPLKQALKILLASGYNSLGYNLARDKMFMQIDNKNVNGQGAVQNTLEGVYTGTLAVGYTSRSDAQTTFNFNTEHTFPQSTFNENEPMRSDLYHLFPTWAPANSERANKPFGYVSNPTWQMGGSKSNSTTFEPRDEQKGPTARAMLYFLVRYQNYQGFVNSTQQSVLKEWNMLFLPDSIEERRNDDIEAYQNNRNPFIDHPELAERITSFISFSQAPVVKGLVATEDTIDFYQIDPAIDYIYDYVLVNNGNTTINISNVQISGNDFLIQDFPDSIQAGEAGVIEIYFDPDNTNAYLETITITSNADNNLLTIPVKANVPPFAAVAVKEKDLFKIYPNPAIDYIIIEGLSVNEYYVIRDIYGRKIYEGKIEAPTFRIPLDYFIPGIYFLEVPGIGCYSRFLKLE